ncbi:MAG: alpha/beta hydrolase [Candidatus Helarchaeota archaeon]
MSFENLLDSTELIGIVFHPTPINRPKETDALKVLEFQLEENGNKIVIAGLFHIRNKKLPSILFFHGNGENAESYNYFIKDFLAAGVNFAIIDYRGYGLSTGIPTLRNLINDPPIIYKFFKEYLDSNGFNPNIFVMGRSLGTVAIGEIANQYPSDPIGFIFESGVADTFRLMHELFGFDIPEEIETKYKQFSNISKIPKIQKPTLVIHGERDSIIPLTQGALIFQLLPKRIDKKIVIIRGANHNGIMLYKEQYFSALTSFIKKYKKYK